MNEEKRKIIINFSLLKAQSMISKDYATQEEVAQTYKDAQIYTQGACDLDPDNLTALSFKGALHLENNEFHEARDSINKILKRDPLSHDAQLLSAKLYFKQKNYTSSNKRKRESIENTKQKRQRILPKNWTFNNGEAPIAISFRGFESEQDAKGMLFDHMRIQRCTKFPTIALMPKSRSFQDYASYETAQEKILRLFTEALKDHATNLKIGLSMDQYILPPFTQDCSRLGLIIIPGRATKTENEPIRLDHENRVISAALNRGQPILAICAGAWRLYEQLYRTTNPDSDTKKILVKVKDHSYGGGMLRLGSLGVRTDYNKQIHSIEITEDSLLKTAMKINENNQFRLNVNSVHSKAVNKEMLPGNTTISAFSKQNGDITIRTRQQKLMEPQEDTAEAFETKFGVPIIGVQWHLEGYDDNYENNAHWNLLQYMAKAGNAYLAKRRMLEELQVHFELKEFKAVDLSERVRIYHKNV